MRSIIPNSPVTGFELRELFFECAFIHRPSLQIDSLREYEARVHTHSATNPRLVFVGANRAETRLAMRDMICVAAHIQKLACTCLNIMRKSLFAAVSSSPVTPETAPGAALRQPSWIEEFRVYRALWHIKLKSNIAKAAQGSWIPSQYSSELRWGGWNWKPFDQEQACSWYESRMNRQDLIEALTISDVLSIVSLSSNTENLSDNIRLTGIAATQGQPKFRPLWAMAPVPLDCELERFTIPAQWAEWRIFQDDLLRAGRKLRQPCSLFEDSCRLFNIMGIFIWDLERTWRLGLTLQPLFTDDEDIESELSSDKLISPEAAISGIKRREQLTVSLMEKLKNRWHSLLFSYSSSVQHDVSYIQDQKKAMSA
ncbi:hypothetical protein N7456_001592 [Penicillium angulare]|uniref:Uncharacterized protein n=1 Tax=Penicillium angulare TaxID=116970 RepID=A0A9W9G6Z7_9EURO|nr:hypothetical protein N7456_001592 [Penicillium angulare]